MNAHLITLTRVLVIAAAMAALVHALARLVVAGPGVHDLVQLAAAFVLCIGAYHVKVDTTSRYGGVHWDIHMAVYMALLVSVGPWVTIVGAAAASLVSDLLGRRRVPAIIANVAFASISISAATTVFDALGGTVGSVSLPADLPALVAAPLVYAAVDVLLVFGYVIGWSENPRLGVKDQRESLAQNYAQYSLDAVIGICLGVVYVLEPWAVLLLAPLGVSLYISTASGLRLKALNNLALEVFANIVDERDPYTAQHSTRVCEFSMRIAEHLGFTERQLERLYWTSRLHDLGKVAVDNEILNKPGRLTDEEFEVIKSHPVVSARILNSFTFDAQSTEIVLCHHERYDGRGYLSRAADDVPFESFIIAVADAFDAMTSDRPYRRALPDDVALAEIARNIGTQFHPVPAEAFLAVMGYAPAAGEDYLHENLGSAGVDRARRAA